MKNLRILLVDVPESLIATPEHWALRGDARWYVYSIDDLDPASAAALGVVPDFDETIHDVKISGGVTFGF